MKLLLVTSVFPSPLQPNRGAFNREMVRAIAGHHQVKTIAPVAWPLVFRARRDGRAWDTARIVDHAEVRHPTYFYTPKVLRDWYGAFFWWSIRRTVADLLQGFAPDVVIGYWSHPDGMSAVRIARQLGVPAVVMVGGTDILMLGQRRSRRRAIRRVLDDADAVVAVSQDLKRALRAWGVPTSKVHVVYRGIDAQRFNPGDRTAARRCVGIEPGTRAVLWVGHMTPVKGLDVLVDACAAAVQRLDLHLYLVGHGSTASELQRRCTRLGIAERVTFAGYVTHADLPDWYRAADLIVLPSRSEGVPNVLLESIACGTPFVASRVGGIPEVADPMVDRLVPPDDRDALADAIVRSLTSPSRITRRTMPISTVDSAGHLLALLTSVVTAYRGSPMKAGEAGVAAGDPVRVQP